MNPPKSKIYFDGKEIVGKEKVGNKLQYVFSDGTRVNNSQMGKIKIECIECKTYKEISLYHKIYDKDYICVSCNKTGAKNPFYGKQHSEEFKNRLSAERKGTWYVGEQNSMFGRKIQDFVSPEKFEEMREKNRQDTLHREYNPFKYSMREILGDEKFEKSIRKAAQTRSEWTTEQKIEYAQKISASQKRLQEKDPVAYSRLKAKGGIAAHAKSISYSMNKFEEQVNVWLNEHNIKHNYSAIMSNGERNYQFDFILNDYRILVECHGTYWHGDPRFFTHKKEDLNLRTLNSTQLNNIKKDKLKKEYAEDKNFKLVILWEHDVNSNNYSALEKELENYENKI